MKKLFTTMTLLALLTNLSFADDSNGDDGPSAGGGTESTCINLYQEEIQSLEDQKTPMAGMVFYTIWPLAQPVAVAKGLERAELSKEIDSLSKVRNVLIETKLGVSKNIVKLTADVNEDRSAESKISSGNVLKVLKTLKENDSFCADDNFIDYETLSAFISNNEIPSDK